MKPIVFQSREEVAALITRLAQFHILDDWCLKNSAFWATSALFYYLDSVPGVVIIDGIIPNREANCHIFLFEKPGKRCKAMVAEIKKEIRRYFRMFGLKRLSGFIPAYNRSSRYLAAALGFKPEGIKRKATVVNGKYSDLCIYSIIDEDLKEVNKHVRDMAKCSRDNRGGNANDGPAIAEQEQQRTGLCDAVEKVAAKEDGGRADFRTTAIALWITKLFRVFRKAKRDSNAVDAKVQPEQNIN